MLEELAEIGDISKMKFDTRSIWAQFLNSPVICMKKEIGWELGSQLGLVKDIDTGSSSDCLGKYLRVAIRMDVTKPQ